jgi:hypothetical protein
MAEASSCYYRLSSSTRTDAVLRKLATVTGVTASQVPLYVNIIHVEYPQGLPPNDVVHRIDPRAMLERNTAPE